MFRNCECKGN